MGVVHRRPVFWAALAVLGLLVLTLIVDPAAPGMVHAERKPLPDRVRGRPVSDVRWVGSVRGPTPAPTRTKATTPQEPEHRAATQPADAGMAALAGRITSEGRGVSARVRFEVGWNEGRVLETARDGTLSAASLYPGYQLVAVSLAGRPTCTRSLFLTPYREASLELDFDVPRPVRVRVLDEVGRPVAGAEVDVDGQPGATDAAGRAVQTSVCSGAAEIVVRAAGHAWFCCAVDRFDAELELRLDPACTLELAMPAVAGAGEAQVYLLPRGTQRLTGHPVRPATPWHLFSPLRVPAGETRRLDDLPAGELEIRVVENGVAAAIERVVLDPRHPVSLTLRVQEPIAGNASAPISLHRLLSRAGLGSLPRTQPLVEPR